MNKKNDRNTNDRIQAAKTGYIVMSLLLCALGIVLIAVPGLSALVICRVGGAILVLFGIVKIVGYFSKDLYRLAFQYDLAFGILLIALGMILIFRSNIMLNIVCIFLGISILTDALLKIQIAIDSKAFGINRWWMILTAAVLTGIIGFLLVLRPLESMQAMMMLLGLSLLTEGILNLITILSVVKIIRDQTTVISDAEYTEIGMKPLF
ncbi:MAG: hypothetical protein HFG41_03705 [Coprococcus sp.]|nr:hypothetical protein [Coprococcus sp.]